MIKSKEIKGEDKMLEKGCEDNQGKEKEKVVGREKNSHSVSLI